MNMRRPLRFAQISLCSIPQGAQKENKQKYRKQLPVLQENLYYLSFSDAWQKPLSIFGVGGFS